MPRFHFNVYDGITERDERGQELPSWDDARLEAIRLSGEFIKNQAKRVALGEDWRMEVTDENDLVLFRLDFSIMASPAMMPARPKRPNEI